MPIPSQVKIKKQGVEIISSIDRAKYYMLELNRAALRDVGKLLRKRQIEKVKKRPGMRRAKRPYNAFQYWVRKREADLQTGIKHATWYGAEQELGTNNQPRHAILRDTTYEHIDDIRRIEGAYIKAIEDENRARGLIDENDEGKNEND